MLSVEKNAFRSSENEMHSLCKTVHGFCFFVSYYESRTYILYRWGIKLPLFIVTGKAFQT
jgi:hypothetical protein